MTTLLNISGRETPTPPREVATTLEELNIGATVLVNSEIVNPQQLDPDALHANNVAGNIQAWWMAMTVEEYNSLVDLYDTNRKVHNIPGSTRMPCFDKVIIATNPQQAATTLLMHLVEAHTATRFQHQWILLTWSQDNMQQPMRYAGEATGLFARAWRYPQLQVESNRVLKLTTTEVATQVIWEIHPTRAMDNMLTCICNKFSWQEGWIWTYNIPLNLRDVEVPPTDEDQRALLQALEYCGTQVTQHLPQDLATKLHMILGNMHSLANKDGYSTKELKYEGSKTTERLRGNSNLPAWMLNSYDEQHVTQMFQDINKWRMENHRVNTLTQHDDAAMGEVGNGPTTADTTTS